MDFNSGLRSDESKTAMRIVSLMRPICNACYFANRFLYAMTRLTRKASAAIKYAAFSASVVLNLNDMREGRIMAYSTNEISCRNLVDGIYGRFFASKSKI